MKLSIAMATYNGAKYLEEQLESFLVQTRQPDELVVTDDGSSDNTLRIVENFANVARFQVRIFRNDTNLGYAQNFARAMSLCTGDLIFLSDQDDVWFERKVEYMTDFAVQNSDAYVVMCNAILTDEFLNNAGVSKIGQIEAGGLPNEAFVMGCCTAVRREFLDIAFPIPQAFPAHDSWVALLADGVGKRRILREALQYYRRHGSNESGFIANRTVRITPDDVSRMKFRLAARGAQENKKQILSSIRAAEQLACGARRAASRVSGSEGREFYRLSFRFAEKASALKKRRKIRSSRLPFRIALAFSFWLRGGYQTFSGYKSMVRDILFR